MNCGCTKHIGCYLPNDQISFGILAPYTGDYIFEIFSNTGFTTIIGKKQSLQNRIQNEREEIATD